MGKISNFIKCLLVFAFLFWVGSLLAQTNGRFKSIASFNTDSTTVKSEIAGLQLMYNNVGALYYNIQSNKWRIFSNGAWSDLGAGGGSGFTNSAANGRLILSNGTNGIESNLAVNDGSIELGKGLGNSNSRYIKSEGSGANVDLVLNSKGTSTIIFQNGTNASAMTLQPNSGTTKLTLIGSPSGIVNFSGDTFGAGNGAHLLLTGGNGKVNNPSNGGHVFIQGGAPFGAGNIGDNFSIGSAGDTVSLNYLEPVLESGTTRNLTASDNSKGIVSSNTLTYTVENLGRVGVSTFVMQDGANTVTLSAGSNVILKGKTATTFDGDVISIWCYKIVGSNAYYLCR